jgi:ATP-dependent Lon protease
MFDDNEQLDKEEQIDKEQEQSKQEQPEQDKGQATALTYLSLQDGFLESIAQDDTPVNEALSKEDDGLFYIPILALKNMVLFPKIAAPISVGREKSANAVRGSEEFFKNWIFVVSQRKAETEEPTQADLYEFGVLAKIIRTIKMPDGTNTVLLQGRHRAKLTKLIDTDPCLIGNIEVIEQADAEADDALAAAILSIREVSEKIIQLSPNIPSEAKNLLRNIEQPNHLLNFVSGNLNIKIAEKQSLLEIFEPIVQAESILKHLHHELQLLQLREGIDNKVRGSLDKQQRDYLLSQQLKTIQDELGENPQQQEIDALKAKAAGKIWPADVQARFDKELAKLQRTNPAAPDYAINLNYLETLTDLPWGEYTADNFDLNQAEIDLNEEHYGMEKIKERILEYLAVLKLRNDMKAPIICLYGPPGVGKTSLGKSIAKALGRKYVRMSLGGLSDEAELRGHRKTYIGALPGRVIQSIKKANSSNPVFLLDEIDKLGQSFRGDPSSALLEILDPEQNNSFYDNYLEIDYDLSKVLFIATANSLNTIQPALLDRMEIIELNGYSIEEKVSIAQKHLVPKQLGEHGLTADNLDLPEATLQAVASDYTRESGVRSLERQVARLMRWTARKVANDEHFHTTIQPEMLEKILGIKRVNNDLYEDDLAAGVAVGLAWTAVGGDILFIEANRHKGKGTLTLTGNLGEVMKESATTALSFLRANADLLGIDGESLESFNFHIHVPAGGIPKDGPSAGITMLSALASCLTGRPLRPNLAMTGEITLRGKVLPVGGIKEKVLAAKRAGIVDIILCKDNKADISEIPEAYLQGLVFHYVSSMYEVLQLALQPEA